MYFITSLLLIKKLLWSYGRAKKSKVGITSKGRGEKKAESERHHVDVATEGNRCLGTLIVNHKPHGKIQNNRNGLV